MIMQARKFFERYDSIRNELKGLFTDSRYQELIERRDNGRGSILTHKEGLELACREIARDRGIYLKQFKHRVKIISKHWLYGPKYHELNVFEEFIKECKTGKYL